MTQGFTPYSITASANNSSVPTGAPEGMKPSRVNDVMRDMMARSRQHAEAGGWFNWGHTPTYIDTDTFSVPGDLRSVYQVGRRVKVSLSGSEVVSSILSTTLSGNATHVTTQEAVLNNTIAEVFLGFSTDIIKVVSGTDGLCTATSTNNGNTIVLVPKTGSLPNPLVKGTTLSFYADSNNAGAVTINGTALKFGTQQLDAGYIKNNEFYEIKYDGTRWLINNKQLVKTRKIRVPFTTKVFFGTRPSTIQSANVLTLDQQSQNPYQDIASGRALELPKNTIIEVEVFGGGQGAGQPRGSTHGPGTTGSAGKDTTLVGTGVDILAKGGGSGTANKGGMTEPEQGAKGQTSGYTGVWADPWYSINVPGKDGVAGDKVTSTIYTTTDKVLDLTIESSDGLDGYAIFTYTV